MRLLLEPPSFCPDAAPTLCGDTVMNAQPPPSFTSPTSSTSLPPPVSPLSTQISQPPRRRPSLLSPEVCQLVTAPTRHKPDTPVTITPPANPSLSIDCAHFPSPIGVGGAHNRHLLKFYFNSPLPRSLPLTFNLRPSTSCAVLRASALSFLQPLRPSTGHKPDTPVTLTPTLSPIPSFACALFPSHRGWGCRASVQQREPVIRSEARISAPPSGFCEENLLFSSSRRSPLLLPVDC